MKKFDFNDVFSAPFDAVLEVGAYEMLWSFHSASFKTLAESFAANGGTRPSELIPEPDARETGIRVLQKIRARTGGLFDVRLHGDAES